MIKFFLDTLKNVRGEPDGKLVFTFFLSLFVLACFPMAWFGKSTPDVLLITAFGFIATAFGMDTYQTVTQINAEKPQVPEQVAITTKGNVIQ